MHRTASVLAPLLLLALSISAAHAGPWYVRGNYYCADSTNDPEAGGTCWGWDGANEMFDDGLHGDDAPNDGIFGAYVPCTEPAGKLGFKVALNDWSESHPNSPIDVFANAVVYAGGPGDVIHFRFDTGYIGDGWQPYFDAVSTDHGMPPGAQLEVIGSAPETGSWNNGIPLNHIGQRWQQVIPIHTPGVYEFKIRVAGTWSEVAFGYDYNNTQGSNAVYQTLLPDTDVLFQFDEITGRVRGIELGQTPSARTSWGQLKTRYR